MMEAVAESLLCRFLESECARAVSDVWEGCSSSLRTVKLLEKLVTENSCQKRLLPLLQHVARRLSAAVPDVPALHAPVLRLLKLCRETEDESGEERVREAVDEVRTELETSSDALAAELAHHVQRGDVVLTLPGDRLLSSLLTTLGCHVMVVGGGGRPGVDLASVDALMPRVDKLVLPAHTLLADGGLLSACGARAAALSARARAVPVLSPAGSCRLSLQMCGRRLSLARLSDPQQVLPRYSDTYRQRATVAAPLLDYVPPELISLFITQTGAVSPWYVHRLISDHYDAQDIALLS